MPHEGFILALYLEVSTALLFLEVTGILLGLLDWAGASRHCLINRVYFSKNHLVTPIHALSTSPFILPHRVLLMYLAVMALKMSAGEREPRHPCPPKHM